LAELVDVGVDRIAARVLPLAAELRSFLQEQGWPVVMPPAPQAATHLVCVGVRGPGGADSTGDPALDRFAQALEQAGVRLAIRRRLLRFGLHAYNNADDIAHVLRIGAHLKRRAAA
jgi:selenocysteine lyase/cysteine desulfurase